MMTTKINDIWDRPRYRHALMAMAALVFLAGMVALIVQHTRRPVEHYSSVAKTSPYAADGNRIAVPAAALASMHRFIDGAVLRKNLTAAWAGSTPAMHGGLTLAQWKTGTIPVQPFSQKSVFTRVKTVESRQKRIWLEVFAVTPQNTAQTTGGLFYVQLVPRNGKWLVNYWGPKGWNPPLPSDNVS